MRELTGRLARAAELEGERTQVLDSTARHQLQLESVLGTARERHQLQDQAVARAQSGETQALTALAAVTQQLEELERALSAERAAHLETKFALEVTRLRAGQTETGLQHLRDELRTATQAGQQAEHGQREVEGALAEARQTATALRGERDGLAQRLQAAGDGYAAAQAQVLADLEREAATVAALSLQVERTSAEMQELQASLATARQQAGALEAGHAAGMAELRVAVLSLRAAVLEGPPAATPLDAMALAAECTCMCGHVEAQRRRDRQGLEEARQGREAYAQMAAHREAQLADADAELQRATGCLQRAEAERQQLQADLTAVLAMHREDDESYTGRLAQLTAQVAALEVGLGQSTQEADTHREVLQRTAHRLAALAGDFPRPRGRHGEGQDDAAAVSPATTAAAATLADRVVSLTDHAIATVHRLAGDVSQAAAQATAAEEETTAQRAEAARLRAVQRALEEAWARERDSLEAGLAQGVREMRDQLEAAEAKLRKGQGQLDEERLHRSRAEAEREALLAAAGDRDAACAAVLACLQVVAHVSCRRITALALHKHLLAGRLATCEVAAEEARRISDAIAQETMSPGARSVKVESHATRRWRVGMLAVVAAKRLLALGQQQHRHYHPQQQPQVATGKSIDSNQIVLLRGLSDIAGQSISHDEVFRKTIECLGETYPPMVTARGWRVDPQSILGRVVGTQRLRRRSGGDGGGGATLRQLVFDFVGRLRECERHRRELLEHSQGLKTLYLQREEALVVAQDEASRATEEARRLRLDLQQVAVERQQMVPLER